MSKQYLLLYENFALFTSKIDDRKWTLSASWFENLELSGIFQYIWYITTLCDIHTAKKTKILELRVKSSNFELKYRISSWNIQFRVAFCNFESLRVDQEVDGIELRGLKIWNYQVFLHIFNALHNVLVDKKVL